MSEDCMKIVEQRGVHVVEFEEATNLDGVNTTAVRPELNELVETAEGRPVLLDFENVAYTCSDALGCLLALRLKAVRTGTRLVLAGIQEHLKEILDITQLNQMFEMFPTRADALEQLAAT